MQALLFTAVGLVNTAVSYGAYALGLMLGLHYALANLVALLVGIAFSFKAQGRFVFDNRDPGRIFHFVACWGGLYLVNIAIIRILVGLGLDAWSAGAIALVPIWVLSFFIQKFFVFKKSPGDGGSSAGRRTVVAQEDSRCSPD